MDTALLTPLLRLLAQLVILLVLFHLIKLELFHY